MFAPEKRGLGTHFPAKALAHEVEDVDRGRIAWTEVCFIQILATPKEEITRVLQAAPGIPLLGGAGTPNRSSVRAVQPPVDDSGPSVVKGNRIDVPIWPPRNTVAPKQDSVPIKRYIKGVIARAVQNQ